MSAIVQMHVYSGRRDPVWAIDARTFKALLHTEVAPFNAESGGHRGLGYRGFTIRAVNAADAERLRDHFGPNAVHTPGGTFLPFQPDAEEMLLRSAPPQLPPHMVKMARIALPRRPPQQAASGMQARCTRSGAVYPNFLPGFWNASYMNREFNNCYNYAADLFTHTFAQPGRASGNQYAEEICTDIIAAAERDGMRFAGTKLERVQLRNPAVEYRVALAVSIWGDDYHWWREDAQGCWSHKIGPLPVTAEDNAGRLITDPRDAARDPFDGFCGYFVTYKGLMVA